MNGIRATTTRARPSSRTPAKTLENKHNGDMRQMPARE
jgi:hypothetical protein